MDMFARNIVGYDVGDDLTTESTASSVEIGS